MQTLVCDPRRAYLFAYHVVEVYVTMLVAKIHNGDGKNEKNEKNEKMKDGKMEKWKKQSCVVRRARKVSDDV